MPLIGPIVETTIQFLRAMQQIMVTGSISTSMPILCGKSQGRVVMLHGGASARELDAERMSCATKSLLEFAEPCLSRLIQGDAVYAVTSALQDLEDDPQFNAGLGAAIQNDGIVRVTASVMDGA